MTAIAPFSIADRMVGPGATPFVIAEMSGNHNRSLDRAFEIVDAAAAAGAHALKIQTYTADTMTLDLADGEFFVSDPENPWRGETLHQLYARAHTPWEWHLPIFDRCRARGMIGFSTPFDDSAVDFLEECNVPCYKIASFENTDIPLIARVARTGKPVILSTGMASESELAETVATLRENGCERFVLLKCTSTYPASPKDTNILTIPSMRERFGCQVGLSDHTLGIGVAVASVALGATVIEKHLTLDRAEGGVDASFSMEPTEFAALVIEAERAWQSLGGVSYGPVGREVKSIAYRRSLYIVRDMRAGEVVTEESVRAIRPGHGLPPKHRAEIIGRRMARDARKGTPVAWDLFA